jgi:hypothetical protein
VVFVRAANHHVGRHIAVFYRIAVGVPLVGIAQGFIAFLGYFERYRLHPKANFFIGGGIAFNAYGWLPYCNLCGGAIARAAPSERSLHAVPDLAYILMNPQGIAVLAEYLTIFIKPHEALPRLRGRGCRQNNVINGGGGIADVEVAQNIGGIRCLYDRNGQRHAKGGVALYAISAASRDSGVASGLRYQKGVFDYSDDKGIVGHVVPPVRQAAARRTRRYVVLAA